VCRNGLTSPLKSDAEVKWRRDRIELPLLPGVHPTLPGTVRGEDVERKGEEQKPWEAEDRVNFAFEIQRNGGCHVSLQKPKTQRKKRWERREGGEHQIKTKTRGQTLILATSKHGGPFRVRVSTGEAASRNWLLRKRPPPGQ